LSKSPFVKHFGSTRSEPELKLNLEPVGGNRITANALSRVCDSGGDSGDDSGSDCGGDNDGDSGVSGDSGNSNVTVV
jgi:hypothetical protein